MVSLERYERKLAETYDVNVRVDLIFNNESIVLPTGSTVPVFFIKTINYDDMCCLKQKKYSILFIILELKLKIYN